MNSSLLFYQYLCWKSIQGKTSSLNSSSIHGKRVQWTRLPYKENEFVELVFLVYFFFTANTTNTIWSSAPSLTRFDQVQTQPSSADAARSDQVRHQVLDTIWSWRSHQVQTQPDLIKQPTEHDLIRKRVQWTRFPCILFFTTNRRNQPALDTIWSSADAARVTCWGSDKKTSSMDSFFIHGRRVRWTRLPYKENEFVELVFLVYFFFIANTTNMIWSSAPSLTRFDQVQTQPNLIKCAIMC